ncbi:hypothetical protein P8610_01490 [Fictibacillus sp. UD]|uniref:hypothetical protein n=1 Tax=Fictibacillus sp. UD TaxID=3038777 RepID=UPI0037452FF5
MLLKSELVEISARSAADKHAGRVLSEKYERHPRIKTNEIESNTYRVQRLRNSISKRLLL